MIPKGWPMEGLADFNAARREAFEEAGVESEVDFVVGVEPYRARHLIEINRRDARITALEGDLDAGRRGLGAHRVESRADFPACDKFEQVAARLKEWQPDALVVGVPCHPDGAPHENTRLAQKFARQLQGRFGLPVYEVDERYSATEAHGLGAQDADAASACIILEQFLRSLP